MSDSPGLLRFLGQRLNRTLPGARHKYGVTRSWLHRNRAAADEARERALDALVIAASSSTLYIAPQHAFHDDLYCKSTSPACECTFGTDRFGSLRDPSHATRPSLQWSSFYRPLVTRSFCLSHVGIGVPECPSFGEVFLRDATSRFALGPLAARWMRQLRKRRGGAVPEGFINASNVARLLMPSRLRACAWEALRPFVSDRHPCRRLPGVAECMALFVAGLK
eukprot:3565193-Prymnesium_polylepis.1